MKIKLASGKGGSGVVHFDRSRTSPRAGPDGGDGGKGGNIILSPTARFRDLSHLKPFNLYKAEDGQSGGERRKKGAKGKDLSIKVPYGTICYDVNGQVLMELDREDKNFLIGGRGGKGNRFFKTARLQAPQQSQPGEKGQKKTVCLEMKWRSDACLIGLRGSGKSSLIYQLHPRLRDKKTKSSSIPHQFSIPLQTTVDSSLLLVDLPGLSASTCQFLRQAERSRLLVFVISLKSHSPQQVYQSLKKELLKYDQKKATQLNKKPCVVILTDEQLNDFKVESADWDCPVKKVCFSSINSQVVQGLLDEICKV